MSLPPGDDRGIAAIWVAVVAAFLVAAAALAVDTSGAFNTAQTDQNTADLSCLAGVTEIPDDPTDGINVAVAYAVDNWPEMAGHTTTITGTTGTYSDGNGNEIFVDAAFGGDDSKMHVRITEVSGSYFSKALGQDGVTVVQEAWCRVNVEASGTGSLPFGAMPGGFQGGLFGPNPCSTGNCGSIVVKRDDVSGKGPTLINNIAHGTDRDLEPLLGNGASALHCDHVNAGDSCHKTGTDTGVSAKHLGDGFITRFEKDLGVGTPCTVKGRTFNCDSPSEVLGSTPFLLKTAFPTTPPPGWVSSLHGDYNVPANTVNHYYFDGVIAQCDSPRLATVPIVTTNMNWNIGDPPTGWPPGSSADVKFIAFLWVILVDPNQASDFHGSGNLKEASTIVMWWGPNTECQGSGGTTYPFDPANPGLPTKTVFLVDDTN